MKLAAVFGSCVLAVAACSPDDTVVVERAAPSTTSTTSFPQPADAPYISDDRVHSPAITVHDLATLRQVTIPARRVEELTWTDDTKLCLTEIDSGELMARVVDVAVQAF